MTSQCRSSVNWACIASLTVPGWCKAFDDRYPRGDMADVEADLGTFL